MTLRGPQNVAPYLYSFALGTTMVGIVNIEAQAAIQMPPFPHEFHMGAERYVAGTATEYYDGYAQCTWNFAFMPHASWQWIINFFTATPANVSVDIFLRTKGQDDEYHYYSAKMHMPEIGRDGRRGVQGYYDVKVRFTQMVLQADP